MVQSIAKVAMLKLAVEPIADPRMGEEQGHTTPGLLATLEISEEGKTITKRKTFPIPAAPQVLAQYRQWKLAYLQLGADSRWRWHDILNHRITIPEVQITNVARGLSQVQLQAEKLEEVLANWFEHSQFRDLREAIIDEVRDDQPLRIVLETRDRTLQCLPWHQWPLFQVRPQAELVLAAPPQGEKRQTLRSPLRILVILGLCDRLDVETDFELLRQQLPSAQILCLRNPSLSQLKDVLFYQSWDILLFAGHSSSGSPEEPGVAQGSGRIFLGQTEIPIASLTQALTTAVRRGLKLAIFNSCDGLGLAEGVSPAQIPNVVVMREPIPDEAAQNFLRYFLQALRSGDAFHLAVRHARERLQEHHQQYPQADWLPVIFQNPSAPSLRLSSRRPWKGAIASLTLLLLLVGGWRGLSQWHSIQQLEKRISGCEDLLIENADTPSEKRQASRACAQKNWQAAQAKLDASLQQTPNDPEARIYRNNAELLANQSPHHTVVISVPIGSNLNVAQEMLRGVAQAQIEFNRNPKNLKKLKVLIANDENNTDLSSQLAERFAKKSDVLAVIGHNATNASMAGAKVYNREKLVMLTPTSFAADLSFYNAAQQYPFAFRMVPDMVTVSKVLGKHIRQQGHDTVAVCVDNSAEDNASFGQDFERTFDGKIVNLDCDLAQENFSSTTAIAQIQAAGATAIVIAPHVDRLEMGLDLARANAQTAQPFALYGSPSFYTQITLEQGASAVAGMVLPSLWHPNDLPKDHPFLQASNTLWGGPVNWRTAMSYDATHILAQELQNLSEKFSQTGSGTQSGKQSLGKTERRIALKESLANPGFRYDGITGSVQFRVPQSIHRSIGLLKVVPTRLAETGDGPPYQFQLLSPSN